MPLKLTATRTSALLSPSTRDSLATARSWTSSLLQSNSNSSNSPRSKARHHNLRSPRHQVNRRHRNMARRHHSPLHTEHHPPARCTHLRDLRLLGILMDLLPDRRLPDPTPMVTPHHPRVTLRMARRLTPGDQEPRLQVHRPACTTTQHTAQSHHLRALILTSLARRHQASHTRLVLQTQAPSRMPSSLCMTTRRSSIRRSKRRSTMVRGV